MPYQHQWLKAKKHPAAGGAVKPDTVLLRCLKQGCPRTKRVRRSLLESWVPKKAVELHTYCPWHDGRCDKGNPEYYFDKQGRRLDWETGKPL